MYAVNNICFHPRYGTFATAGSDGVYTFWDKDSKQRLKLFNRMDQSITSASFNRDGNIYAYAVCMRQFCELLVLILHVLAVSGFV